MSLLFKSSDVVGIIPSVFKNCRYRTVKRGIDSYSSAPMETIPTGIQEHHRVFHVCNLPLSSQNPSRLYAACETDKVQ